jgi:hypothetical protein
VSIKLKLRESPVEYKLAIYYLPLAAALNQESLEKDAPEAGGLTPAPSDQSMNPMPLIEY